MAKRRYLIWSNEHNAWWKPNRQGYTPELAGAGEYEEREAVSVICTDWMWSNHPYETLYPAGIAKRILKLRGTREKIAALDLPAAPKETSTQQQQQQEPPTPTQESADGK